MKYKLILTYFLISILSLQLYAQCGNLIWSDEFNGNSLDNTKWTAQTGNGCPNCGWGNSELQNYTTNTNNLRVENGTLVLEARNASGNYTSGRITSAGKFERRYGRFEMRAKLPFGTGLWPAFWLLPAAGAPTWPQSGEIDIMENRGDQASTIGGALHYGQLVPNNRSDGTAYTLPSGNFTDNFHVFAVDWQVGRIDWSVDGVIFKTETATPNTLNPPSNGAAWPWDNYNFYILLNLAVGSINTPYTGFQNPNFGLSGKYEIDYVRVYDAAQPQLTITGRSRVFENSVKTYSIPAGVNRTYAWTVPAGATITAGQGTTSITVNWGTSAGGDVRVDVTHNVGATCPGKVFFYTKLVEVYKNNCQVTLLNFEGITAMSTGLAPGALTEVNNPGSSAINSSGRTARYVRNGGQQYDALFYENCLLDNGPEYASATPTYRILMDVYTTAPIGTVVQLQLGNQAAWGAYPAGIHSAYTATTTAVNQWQTLIFTYVNSPDGAGAGYQNNLDRAVILFNPNSYTNHIYHFDNIRRELRIPAPTLAVSGSPSAVTNATNIPYSVTGYDNASHSFLWNVPVGATISSGASTTSTTVDFGSLGGFVTVQEQMPSGCYGPLAKQAVSVGTNSCAIFADEFDNYQPTPWLANSSGAGFSHSEKISEWKNTSGGHGEWDYVDYTLNDGTNPILLNFNNPVNIPMLKFRARVATGNALIRVTLVDDLGRVANNQYLNPINAFELTTTSQEFSIDFTNQLWDQYGGGGLLDPSKIAKVRISFNPAFVSFPHVGVYRTYNTAFIGQVFIDYIRMGSECPTPTANFSATDLILCGTGAGNTTTFIDNSISAVAGTTYNWNFGAGAVPATSNTMGPHNVYYSTPGWKSVTLTLNGSGSSRTKTSYIYVSPPPNNCVYADQFGLASLSPFIASQGNFNFTQNGTNLTMNTTGHGEWETFTDEINDGTLTRPVDFSCANITPTVTIRARSSAPVALRLGLMDNGNVAMANVGVSNRTLELTTAFQVYTINLRGLFTDIYSAGGPYQVDSTEIRKIQFRVNPGFSSAPWTGPLQGIHNTTFNGSIDIDYISIGTNCAGALPLTFVNSGFDEAVDALILYWKTSGEKNVETFLIQEWIEGSYYTIGESKPLLGNFNEYQFKLNRNEHKKRIFRIVAVDHDMKEYYSPLIKYDSMDSRTGYIIYPNPFHDKLVIHSNAEFSGNKYISISSSDGNYSSTKEWLNVEREITIGEGLVPGIYFVTITDGFQVETLKIVKQ